MDVDRESPSAAKVPTGSARSRAAIHRERIALRSHPTFKDKAAAYLRQEILEGRLQPGTKIDQGEIAATLGMSRVPVREALIELTQEHLVESTARRGSCVARINEDDILDQYQIQGMIAGIAARRAALRMSDDQLAELRAIHDEFVGAESHDAQSALNLDFYEPIFESGGSSRLMSVLRLLYRSLPMEYWEATPTWRDRTTRRHEELLEALERRDGDAAAAAMQRMLSEGGEQTVELLRARGLWSASN